MSPISHLIFRFARWVAGDERSEWIDAMEAEAADLGGGDLGWAVGCATASLRVRFSRERKFLLAILVLPICAVLAEFALFFPLVWLTRSLGLPGAIWILALMLVPLPFAYLLGRIRPRTGALLAAPISFAIFTFIPWSVHWIQFGTPILTWLGENATIYMMPPFVGLSCSLLLWLFGAWLGSRSASTA